MLAKDELHYLPGSQEVTNTGQSDVSGRGLKGQ